MQEKQKDSGKSNCGGNGPGGGPVEKRERRSGNDDHDGEEREMAESEACSGVGGVAGIAREAFGAMLPGIDQETVECAKGSKEESWQKQGKAKRGIAGDSGDERGGCKEKTNCELLRQAMSAAGGVNQDEVAEGQSAQDEIEVNRL